MSELVIGAAPQHIRQKARAVLEGSECLPNAGWKKIKRVRRCYSFKLGKGFRLLWRLGEPVVLCDHDQYVRKIKSMHPRGGANAAGV